MKRLALIAWLALASGCASSAVQQHARASVLVSSALVTAGGAVDAAFDAELEAAQDDAAIDQVEARWKPVGAAFDLARETVNAWNDAIDAAFIAQAPDADVFAILYPFLARAILLYEKIAELSQSLGVDVPRLPSIVTQLAGALSAR